MRSRRLAGAVGLVSCLVSAHAAAGQVRPDTADQFSIADRPAPAGARTVCVGRHDHGVRMVGCFDAYQLQNGGLFDSNKKVQLRQFVWKYTAEARTAGRSKAVTSLTGEVRSDVGDTYDWAPGGDLRLSAPTSLDSAVTVDLLPDRSTGAGKPAVVSAKDGWRYTALTGEIVPYLNTHLHSVTWNASSKQLPDRGDIAQVAGATLWGVPEPAPSVMPTHLRLEARYR